MFECGDHHHDRGFTIGGIAPEIMSLLLDFIYTGSASLTRTKVQDVARAADMLLLDDLVKYCFQYMEHHMCPEDCIGIWKFSDFVISPTTRALAWRYILSHFKQVTKSREFLELLTAEDLMSIIETDELFVRNECSVFEAIQMWINHDLEGRRPMFPQLFTKVRVSMFCNVCS